MRVHVLPGLLCAASMIVSAADWPQFRGPNGAGLGEAKNLPVEFGPGKNMLWRTPLPEGYSSPVLVGPRIYVTAVENDKLFTIAMERATGRILWRREAPRSRKQEIQRANSPVSASPVSDGTNVWVFFQDFGLLAYGPDGNELWRMALGPFNNPFGHGSSPVLAGNLLLMNIDQDVNSYLLALDNSSGKVVWRADRPMAQRGYATPILYKDQVLIAGSYRLTGYELKTGKQLWYIRKLPWQIKPTPVLDGDTVYFTTFSAESDPGEQEDVPEFAAALAKLDTDKDGKLSKDEITDKKMKARFDEYLDLDDSGFLEEHDWEQFRERRKGENGLRAYDIAGAKGDITESGFLWKNAKSLPNVPSPLIYRGVLYILKEGGVFTSMDPKTGAVLKQGRLQGALGGYYASPVASDGRIYLTSEEGAISVLQAGAQWEILAVNDMGEQAKATPALVDDKIYLRTFKALYCFGVR
ncbi:MAG: PQQ-binding-like beta-propeller repeat protein [Bryobacteraceae bacterium]